MKLSAYLDLKNISAAEFGRLVGASRSAVVRWKSGDRFPGRQKLQKIESITKGAVTAGDFLHRDAA